jgi:hypothetical protein
VHTAGCCKRLVLVCSALVGQESQAYCSSSHEQWHVWFASAIVAPTAYLFVRQPALVLPTGKLHPAACQPLRTSCSKEPQAQQQQVERVAACQQLQRQQSRCHCWQQCGSAMWMVQGWWEWRSWTQAQGGALGTVAVLAMRTLSVRRQRGGKYLPCCAYSSSQ